MAKLGKNCYMLTFFSNFKFYFFKYIFLFFGLLETETEIHMWMAKISL